MTTHGKLASAVTGDVPGKLWHGMIYERSVNLIAGPSGVGKSFLGVKLSADLSRTRGFVIYCNAEDDSVMQRFRLEAAGADLDKILLARFVMPRDAQALRQTILANAAVAVIFDTAAKHIDGPMQRWDGPLNEVHDLMQETNCSALYVHHTNKNVKKSMDWRAGIGGATSGLTGTARAIGLVGKRPGFDDQLVWCPVKDANAQTPLAISFEWNVDEIDQANGDPIEVAHLSLTEVDVTIANPTALVVIQGDGDGKTGPDPVKSAEAADFLTANLADGAWPVNDVYRCKSNPDSTESDPGADDWKSRECGFLSVKAVNAAGGACPHCDGDVTEFEGLKSRAESASVSWGTIKRAKTALTVESGKKGFSTSAVGYWYLPDGHPALSTTALDYLP